MGFERAATRSVSYRCWPKAAQPLWSRLYRSADIMGALCSRGHTAARPNRAWSYLNADQCRGELGSGKAIIDVASMNCSGPPIRQASAKGHPASGGRYGTRRLSRAPGAGRAAETETSTLPRVPISVLQQPINCPLASGAAAQADAAAESDSNGQDRVASSNSMDVSILNTAANCRPRRHVGSMTAPQKA